MPTRPLIPVDASDLLVVVSALHELAVYGGMSKKTKDGLASLEAQLERQLQPQGALDA